MAQVDTGMGWSAKSEWLKSAAGALCEIVESALTLDFPTIVASTPPPWSSCVALGQYCTVNGNTAYLGIWGSTAPEVNVAICKDYAYNRGWWAYFFTTSSDRQPSGSFMFATADNSIVYNAGGGGVGTPTYDAGTGIYYTRAYAMGGYGSADTLVMSSGTIPVFETVQDALTYYKGTSQVYSKLNQGYAVATVASWYTPEGTHLLSPVLISTNPDNTTITTDGQTPADNMTTFNFLKDGLRFYMTLIGGISADDASVSVSTVQTALLEQFSAAAPVKVFRLIADSSFSNIVVTSSPDPYQQEGEASEEEGGDGTDQDDDPVEEETLPIPAVTGLGFSTIYVPTAYDLYQLASYLWGGNLDLDNFLRLFANPMDSILGLSAVPVALSGTYEPIYLGGQLLQGVTMPRYSGRTAVKVDMGTTTITERWGSYLDYDPYTEISVYLPFIGIKNIKADDVMGKTVSLMYNIDILSGACVAYLRTTGGSVLYEWAGQCAMQIPITGSNWDNIFSTAISAAVTLGGAMVAPASAPMLAGSVASAAVQAVAAKPRVERSGAVTGVTGFLGQLRPYIIRTIPEAYIPNEQNKFIGYPSYISASLGNLTGYNEVASIHLENIPATGDELSELESILKGGVIF